MRKFSAALVLLLLAGVAQAEQALLWEIERNGKVSHLFGTFHSPDPRVTRLPPPAEEAFSEAETVVLEMQLDPSTSVELAMKMLLPDGVALKDRLPEELYRKALDAGAKLGYPAAALERMQPWALVLLLSVPPSAGPVLDQILFNRATQAGKAVVGLETAEEQTAVFADLSHSEQLALLRQAVAESARLGDEMERMTRAYLEKDLDTLRQQHESSLKELPGALGGKFNRRLLTARDSRMAERMAPILEEGDSFVAVGALHLRGIVRRLRGDGYTVTAVY